MGANKAVCSNLTNKYNPQELSPPSVLYFIVQILPINTILKNAEILASLSVVFKSYQ